MDKEGLEALSTLDLIVLQHELKRFPEDAKELQDISEEIEVRYRKQMKEENKEK